MHFSWVRLGVSLGLLPFIEFILLRFSFRSLLGLRVGWPAMADSDYFLPTVVGFFLYVFLANLGEPIKLAFNRRGALLHLFLLAGLVGFSILLAKGILPFGTVARLAWWILALSTFGSSLLLWLEPSYLFSRRSIVIAIPCLLLAGANGIHMGIFPEMGAMFTQVIGRQTCGLTQFAFGSSVECIVSKHGITLRHPYLMFIVGSGCSGTDAFLFSALSFAAYFLVRRKEVGLFVLATLLLFNEFFFHLVNLFRIFLIALAGIGMESQALAMGLFHTHAGWLLYASAQFLFIYALEKFGVADIGDPTRRMKPQSRFFLGLLIAAVLGLPFALYHKAIIAACTVESCVERLDCDANSGDGNYDNCKACLIYTTNECAPCSTATALSGDECTKQGNNAVCHWTGSACVDLPTVPELPDGLRVLLLGLGILVPIGWNTRSKNARLTRKDQDKK